MPLEKQFDEDQALERAMRAFWKNGFEATSMQQLLDCMGIQRGSFYATFKDKRTVFRMSLELYKKQTEQWFSEINRTKKPKQAILHVFDSILKDAEYPKTYCGCFLVNTSLELAPHDREISGLVETGFQMTEAFFQRMIEKAQAAGTISNAISPEDMSRLLVGMVAGLRVVSRGRRNLESAKAIVGHAKCLLS